MSASIYTEKLVEPDDKMLTHDLSASKKYLDTIATFIEKEYGDSNALSKLLKLNEEAK